MPPLARALPRPHFAAGQPADMSGHQTQNDSGLAFVFALFAVAFAGLALLLPNLIPGRWGFMSALLMGLALDAAIWFGIIKNDHRCFALKFAFVAGWISRVFPLGMCLTLPLSDDYLFPWGGVLFDAPLTAGLGRSLTSVCIVAIFLFSRPFFPQKPNDMPVRKMLSRTSDRFELFLIIAGIIKLGYWLSLTGLTNPIFYFNRILIATIAFIPFFVGFSFFRYKRASIFWLGILAFELVVAFLTGTRGSAFTPIMYFLIGFVLGLPNWRSVFRWSFLLAPLCLALLVAGVFIGAVRDVVGRTDLETALTEGSMLEAMDDTSVMTSLNMTGGIAYKAFQRLSGWTSFVIPVMTPERVPFRGYGDFWREIRSVTTLGFFALDNRQFRGNIYFGNIYLKAYGFPVHVDGYGRQVSNVAFPIHVDAFTRGGWLPAIGFLLIAYGVMFVVERAFRQKCLPLKQPYFLIMLTVLCYLAANVYGKDTFVNSMRAVALEGTFCALFWYGVDRTLRYMGKAEKDPRGFKIQ